MESRDSQVVVENNEAEQRYEVQQDGNIAFLTYERADDTITYFHTETPPALAGHGVGSALARAALEEARANNWTVVPLCPFVSAYIRRHQEYLPLVAERWKAHVTRR